MVGTEEYADPPSPIPCVPPEESQLLPDQPIPQPRHVPSRAPTSTSFVSSPLNPTSSYPPQVTNLFSSARSRPVSRPSHDAAPTYRDSTHSSLSQAPSSFPSPQTTGMGLGGPGVRGSMILYRLASDDDKEKEPAASIGTPDSQLLLPPKLPVNFRDSVVSDSRSSFISTDSKYGGLSHGDSAFPNTRGGLVPYEYDPALDELDPVDDEDMLHDPSAKGKFRQNTFPWRGIMNVAVLGMLILGLLALFVFYPVFAFYRDRARNNQIDGNIRINATGKLVLILQLHVH